MQFQNKTVISLILSSLFLMGFDYAKHSIPLDEIYDGGPPKDGIPALFDPIFMTADEVDYLHPQDRVLGLTIQGEAKAYPLNILNWHELINDQLGNKDVLVSFCPLCGTGMAFDAHINGERFLFGVSGKLYNSDVLFYDKKTESLWSQLKMKSVTGPMTGTKLNLLPLENTTWKAWHQKYPDTRVLSTDTGYRRDYSNNPYQHYEKSDRLMFPLKHEDNRLSRKTWVLGIIINGKAKAYPFDRLPKGSKVLYDHVGHEKLIIYYDTENRSAWVKNFQGDIVPSIHAFWFAWSAFYPDTAVYQSSK